MSRASHYRAFISYSHVDAAFAKHLHRKLESYRLPRHLIGDETPCGPIPARLTPIFRDLDELPASNDLSAEIKSALAESETLIVLCSPDACASQWVKREIELFRALHGDQRPILAAILRGEPSAVMPNSLRQTEDPIAADFRPGKGGKTLALMKLVAGMTGAGLGDLVQRDAQRRLRRVMVITGAAVIAMLVTASLMVFALRARSEAEHQRAEAEGLIEYMLTDLRERLRGVGRTDVMAAVNARAMAYYAESDISTLPPESLEKRARIFHAMGEDEDVLGLKLPATEKFLAAHRTTAALLAQRPNDPEVIFAHAQSDYWVGYAATQRKDWATAKTYWEDYLQQAQRLLAVEGRKTRALMEMGYAHGNLCELSYEQALPSDEGTKLKDAEAACRQSILFEKQALRTAPKDPKINAAVANRHGWLANVLTKSRDFEGALAERQSEAALLDGLIRRDPKNVDLRLRRLWVTDGLMRIAAARQDKPGTKVHFDTIISALDGLIAQAGRRGDLLTKKAQTLLWMAKQLRLWGDPEWEPILNLAEAANTEMAKVVDEPSKAVAYASTIKKVRNGDVQ